MAGHLVELAALLMQPHPETALLVEDVGHFKPQAAEMRAKVKTITPIKARSRSPMTVSFSTERSSSPATGALPLPSFWRGAFAVSAGLCSSTAPVTRWSNSVRKGVRLHRTNAWAMVRRQARAAGITTEVCNHTFRGTGITAYLEDCGKLEKARQMAAHASTRTTQLMTGARTASRLMRS